jgi:6-phosphogluconate dehydrogenase
LKAERVKRQSSSGPGTPAFAGDRAKLIEAVGDALYASKIISYAQGFVQLGAASKLYDWALNSETSLRSGVADASSAPTS